MKKWHSTLLIGLVAILAGLLIWLAASDARGDFTQGDLDAAYQDGYTTGYDQGHAAGYDEGYEAGYEKGREDCGVEPDTDSDKCPPNAILWHDAKNHIGDRATENSPVCGPVAGAAYRPDIRGQPTWLNIGEGFPSPNRFVVIIWGQNRASFPHPPEEYYLGRTVCVTGLIQEYDGIAQIEATDATQVQDC